MYLFHRVKRYVRDFWFWTRMTWQKLYRLDHIADIDVWGINSYFITKMYPLVKKFIRYKRHGHPCLEEFYQGEDQDKWDSAGAEKRWEEILQEILFAFEFYYQDEFYDKTAKRLQKKLKKLYGDWEEKKLKYASIWTSANFKEIEGLSIKNVIVNYDELTNNDKLILEKEHGKNWLEKTANYHNHKLHGELHDRAQKGMELFGKYIMGMWD